LRLSDPSGGGKRAGLDGITAMFIATGQDVANVSESSAGVVYTEVTPKWGPFEIGALADRRHGEQKLLERLPSLGNWRR
jgi:hypothetical protein